MENRPSDIRPLKKKHKQNGEGLSTRANRNTGDISNL